MKQNMFNGYTLAERRKEMGLTPLDVSCKIHVPVNYIEAMERGDVRALPPPCYTTGFVKSYCTLLGLDATPFLQAYAATVRPPRRGSLTLPPALQTLLRRRTFSDILTWAAICALIALGWIAYMFVVDPQGAKADNRVEAGTIEIAEPFPPLPPAAE